MKGNLKLTYEHSLPELLHEFFEGGDVVVEGPGVDIEVGPVQALVLAQGQHLVQVEAGHLDVAQALLQPLKVDRFFIVAHQLLHDGRWYDRQPIVEHLRFQLLQEHGIQVHVDHQLAEQYVTGQLAKYCQLDLD